MAERIRPATAGDQAEIGRLVRQARLNPRALDNPVGVAQVGRHPPPGEVLGVAAVQQSEHRVAFVAEQGVDHEGGDQRKPGQHEHCCFRGGVTRAAPWAWGGERSIGVYVVAKTGVPSVETTGWLPF